MLQTAKGAEVRVGLRSSGNPSADNELLTYAASNEFGTRDGRVPERSFMRSTMMSNRAQFTRLVRDVFKKAKTPADIERRLDQLGARAVREVVKTIRSDVPPPNAPSTVAKKGSSGTLRDTGRLAQSISHETKVGR